METFRFAATRLPAEAEDLRARARAFLDAERGRGEWASHRSTWTSFDPEFSRMLALAAIQVKDLQSEGLHRTAQPVLQHIRRPRSMYLRRRGGQPRNQSSLTRARYPAPKDIVSRDSRHLY